MVQKHLVDALIIEFASRLASYIDENCSHVAVCFLGFMTPAEYKQYEKMKTKHVKYFIPLVWFSNLLSKVRQERRIYDDITYLEILKVIIF